MLSYIFKKEYPKEKFKQLLIDITISQKDKTNFFDINLYKKYIFNNKIQEFIQDVLPYYHKNKVFYVTRDMNYKYFITIIRQLCKLHNIKYIKKIKYCNNSYNINYFFTIE